MARSPTGRGGGIGGLKAAVWSPGVIFSLRSGRVLQGTGVGKIPGVLTTQLEAEEPLYPSPPSTAWEAQSLLYRWRMSTAPS